MANEYNKSADSPPRILYRYRRPHRNTLRSLRDKRVWFSTPGKLNDPFEFSNKIKPSVTVSEWRSFCEGEVARGKISKQDLSEAINCGLDPLKKDVAKHILLQCRENAYQVYKKTLRFGVCCFSENSKNILMWSHYAKNHEGVCLGFDTSLNNFFGGHAEKVSYLKEEKLPVITSGELMADSNKVDNLIGFFLNYKHLSWKYEDEWRVLISEGEGIHNYPAESLKEVIFGMRTTSSWKKKIMKALSYDEDIKYFEAKMKEGHLALDLVPIDHKCL